MRVNDDSVLEIVSRLEMLIVIMSLEIVSGLLLVLLMNAEYNAEKNLTFERLCATGLEMIIHLFSESWSLIVYQI